MLTVEIIARADGKQDEPEVRQRYPVRGCKGEGHDTSDNKTRPFNAGKEQRRWMVQQDVGLARLKW